MRQTMLPLILLMSLAVSAQNYRLGPSDLLKITVIELEDMGGEYRVDNSGNLNLPFIGLVKAQDKTIDQFRSELIDRLAKDLINDPQVFVDIVEVNWRPINVIGAVNNPGKLQKVFQNITLVDAITHAGGIQDNAGDTILIMRSTPEGLTETLKVSYTELLIEGKAYLNIPIQAGDTINIPVEKPLLVSVLGEINKPGEYTFKSNSRVTLLRVIAAAGGFTDFAKRNRVAVRRNGKEERVDVKAIVEDGEPDYLMEDGDIVSVP